MIHFFLSNPLLNRKMSNYNFNKISAAHIARIKAFAPDPADTLFGVTVTTIMSSMIADTEAVYDAWRSTEDVESTERSKKEGRTISVDDSITDLKSFISRKKGVIADKFPKGTPAFEEFFPLGLREYSRMTKKDADTILKRFVNAVDAHKADLDPAILSEANSKYNIYLQLRKDQLQSIGKVKDGMTESERKRIRLAVQIYRNLLTLLLLNAEEPEKARNFFDESILKRKPGDQKPAALPAK